MQIMKKIIILILFFIFFLNFKIHSDELYKVIIYKNYYNIFLKKNINYKEFMYANFLENNKNLDFDFITLFYLDKLKNHEFKKVENPIRRAEILFFGSLTFVTFGGWLFFSIFNVLIYNDTFGKIRKEQFLPLYLGSCIISFSVVISDLFINMKPKINKNIEIY